MSGEIPSWGRPTIYKGVKMRSRLEARWAAYFDAVEPYWKYEPNAFANEKGQYLPDFLVSYKDPAISGVPFPDAYYEVKGVVPSNLDAVMERMEIIFDSDSEAALFLVIGVPQDDIWFDGWIGRKIDNGFIFWKKLGTGPDESPTRLVHPDGDVCVWATTNA